MIRVLPFLVVASTITPMNRPTITAMRNTRIANTILYLSNINNLQCNDAFHQIQLELYDTSLYCFFTTNWHCDLKDLGPYKLSKFYDSERRPLIFSW